MKVLILIIKMICLIAGIYGCGPGGLQNRAGGFFSEKESGSSTNSNKENNNPKDADEGLDGYLVELENARLRCQFAESTPATYTVECNAVVKLRDGREVLPDGVRGGYKTKFMMPEVISGNGTVGECKASPLQQTCTIRDVITAAEILAVLEIQEVATGIKRAESSTVLLPYSVRSAAGYVLLSSDLFSSTNLADSRGDDVAPSKTVEFGFQPRRRENSKTAILTPQSTCQNKLGYFVSQVGYVLRSKEGYTEVFAGSFVRSETLDLTHRLRLSLGDFAFYLFASGGMPIACEEDAVLVASSKHHKIFRLRETGPVEIVHDLGDSTVVFTDIAIDPNNKIVFGIANSGLGYQARRVTGLSQSEEILSKELEKVSGTELKFIQGASDYLLIVTPYGIYKLGRNNSILPYFNNQTEASDRRYAQVFSEIDGKLLMFGDRLKWWEETGIITDFEPAVELPGSGRLIGEITEDSLYIARSGGVSILRHDSGEVLPFIGDSLNTTTSARDVVVSEFNSSVFSGKEGEIFASVYRRHGDYILDSYFTSYGVARINTTDNKMEDIRGGPVLNSKTSFSTQEPGVFAQIRRDATDKLFGLMIRLPSPNSYYLTPFSTHIYEISKNGNAIYYAPESVTDERIQGFDIGPDGKMYLLVFESGGGGFKNKLKVLNQGISTVVYQFSDSDPLRPFPNPGFEVPMRVLHDGSVLFWSWAGLAKLAPGKSGSVAPDSSVSLIAGSGATVIGNGDISGMKASDIQIKEIQAIDADRQGNAYFASGRYVLKVNRNGVIHVLFGHQRAQDCGSGVVESSAPKAAFTEAFTASLALFCSGIRVTTLAIDDRCDETSGVISMAFGIRHPDETSNLVTATQKCPED